MSTRSNHRSATRSKPMSVSEFKDLKKFAGQNVLAVAEQLLPGGSVIGKEYVVLNPTRADKRAGSLKICVSGPKVGVWSDFATGDKGRDSVSLVSHFKAISRADAALWIRANVWPPTNIMPQTESNSAWTTQPNGSPTAPDTVSPEVPGTAPTLESDAITALPPDKAEHPARALRRMGYPIPDMQWTYRNAGGAICCYVLRWNEADGSKRILPFSWVRSGKAERWAFKAWPGDRPLYNLDKIAANLQALVIICEGEKAAVAAGKLYAHADHRGVVATTSSGGAGAAGKTDWTPLARRFVRIWPDADEAGLKYADEVAKRLEEIGCKVQIIDAMALAAKTPTGEAREAPKGWDAADASAEWESHEALRKAINRLASPYSPGPAYISYGPYTMTKDGLTLEGKALGGAPIRISAPFEVLGESRNPGSLEWGKMLRFLDGDGKLHNRIAPNALMQGEPAILCSLLASEGLAIHPDYKKHLLSYLAGAQSNRRATVVMRTGWHEIEGSKRFVLPSETGRPASDRWSPIISYPS